MPKIYDPEMSAMPSYLRAEIEAEERRRLLQEEMLRKQAELGAPRITGSEGQFREFQSPDMTRRTYTEAGDLTSIELSPFYQNEYSPYNQRQIEKLYETRSKAAMNPELTEEERQAFFDKIDTDISKVPRLTPIMRQPTPQQVFEQAIVTDPITGTRGFFNPKSGDFNPINADQKKEHEKLWWGRYDKNVSALRSSNESELVLPKNKMNDEQILERARSITDREVGSLSMYEEQPGMPEDELSKKYGLKRGEGSVTSEGMTTDVSGGKLFTTMSDAGDLMQKFGQGRPYQAGNFIPPAFAEDWDKLTSEDQQDITDLLNAGYTASQIKAKLVMAGIL